MIAVHEIVIRLLLGAVIGGVIGFEREIHGRSAGFRTQLLVCLAAVLIMIISENYYYYVHNVDDTLRIDPARISAGALIGIGFLGAGVIVKSGNAVRGLTTAASIWIVSAIGLAIGGGLYFEGVFAAVLTITVLTALRFVERRIKTTRYTNIIVSTAADTKAEESILSVINKYKIHLHTTNYETNRERSEIAFNFTVSTRDRDSVRELFYELNSLDLIRSVKISG